MTSKGHILITGATGLVGRDMMYHYAAQGYEVTAISRRKPHLIPSGANWLSLDLFDTELCIKTIGALKDIIQIVFAALYEESDLVKGWQGKEHGKKNTLMLKNTVEGVLSGESKESLRNVVILQGPKAYGVHVHPVRPGAREGRDEDRDIPVSSLYYIIIPHRPFEKSENTISRFQRISD
jgi:nucleoside-diphosphate-sugar epimerase